MTISTTNQIGINQTPVDLHEELLIQSLEGQDNLRMRPTKIIKTNKLKVAFNCLAKRISDILLNYQKVDFSMPITKHKLKKEFLMDK